MAAATHLIHAHIKANAANQDLYTSGGPEALVAVASTADDPFSGGDAMSEFQNNLMTANRAPFYTRNSSSTTDKPGSFINLLVPRHRQLRVATNGTMMPLGAHMTDRLAPEGADWTTSDGRRVTRTSDMHNEDVAQPSAFAIRVSEFVQYLTTGAASLMARSFSWYALIGLGYVLVLSVWSIGEQIRDLDFADATLLISLVLTYVAHLDISNDIASFDANPKRFLSWIQSIEDMSDLLEACIVAHFGWAARGDYIRGDPTATTWWLSPELDQTDRWGKTLDGPDDEDGRITGVFSDAYAHTLKRPIFCRENNEVPMRDVSDERYDGDEEDDVDSDDDDDERVCVEQFIAPGYRLPRRDVQQSTHVLHEAVIGLVAMVHAALLVFQEMESGFTDEVELSKFRQLINDMSQRVNILTRLGIVDDTSFAAINRHLDMMRSHINQAAVDNRWRSPEFIQKHIRLVTGVYLYIVLPIQMYSDVEVWTVVVYPVVMSLFEGVSIFRKWQGNAFDFKNTRFHTTLFCDLQNRATHYVVAALNHYIVTLEYMFGGEREAKFALGVLGDARFYRLAQYGQLARVCTWSRIFDSISRLNREAGDYITRQRLHYRL